MAPISCDVCMGKDDCVERTPFLSPLLDKHLGILVQAQVKSCTACIQLLQMWDDFSNQAKRNLRITHPNANFQLRKDKAHQTSSEAEPIILLDSDDESDTSEVLICEDDADVLCDSPTQSDVRAINNNLPVQENLPLVDLDLACDSDEPLLRVAPPVVWDMPSVSPEESISEPLTDPLNLLPVQVKEEPLEINTVTLNVKQEANLEVDPLKELDVKPNLAVVHSDIQEETTRYSCSLCNQKFFSQQILNIHTKSKHRKKVLENKSKSVVMYQCPKCEKTLPSKEALTHILIHDAETFSPGPVKLDSIHLCEICCKSFQNQEILLTHMKNVHLQNNATTESETNSVQCPFCFHNYTNLKTLERHISLMHPDPSAMAFVSKKNNNVICDICQVNLCSKKILKFHILNVHADILKNSSQKCSRTQIYPCQICNIKLRSLELMKRHLIQDHKLQQSNMQNSNNKNTCDNIAKPEKSTENNAEVSIRKYYKCKICNQICTSLEALHQHKLNKHALKNTRYGLANNIKFSCAPCSKTFSCKESLDGHNKKCHDMDPQGGQNNEMSLKSKEILVNNASSRTTCHICKRKFKTRRGLASHLLWHEEQLKVNTATQLQSKVIVEKKLNETKTNTDKSKSKPEASSKYKIYEDKFKRRDGMYFCNFCLTSRDSLTKIVFHLRHDHLPKNYAAQVMKAQMTNTNENETSKDCRVNSGSNMNLLTKRIKLDESSTCNSESDLQTSKQQTTEEILLDLIINKKFSCSFCHKILDTMEAIYRHCKRNHEEKINLIKKSFCITCNICADNEKIFSMASLGLHIENKHKQHVYTTEPKDKTMTLKPCSPIEIAILLNSKEEGMSGCQPTGSQLTMLDNNESTEPTVKIFDCSFCKKTFYSKTAVQCHVQQSHLNKKKR